jgi:thiamine-phosphate pyrophosphorylase
MVDLRLNAIVDPEQSGARALADLARAVVAGGATLVQLRDKRGETRQLVDEARAIKAVLAGSGVPLLINDRVDVALAVEADGVHVGQHDMSVQDVRRLLGPDAIIGLSIQTPEQVRAAPLDIIDYAGIGGVYATTSKTAVKKPIGPEGLRRIVQVLRERGANFPTCGIAGINAGNAGAVIAAGADGVAVISALSHAADPAAAARELRAVVDGALARRGER